jgi:signal transduction histidine kinase
MQARRGRTLPLRHLLVLLTAIGLLPLALLGIWSIHVASEYRQREQERALLDMARALSSAVDAELDSSVAALSSMAQHPAMLAGDIRDFYDVARIQVQSQPEWLGVYLADESGATLFRTTSPYGAPADVPVDPASLQQALSLHRAVVGRISRGKGGRAAVPVRIPVTDSHGHAHVLTAVVKPDRILRVIERQQAPSDSLIAVIDASGHIVARSKNQERFVTQPITPALRELMRKNGMEGAGGTLTKEGDLVTTAYSSMSRYGWSVVTNTPMSTLHAGFFEGIAVYAAGIALSLAVCIGLAYWLSGRFVGAFNHLRRAAAALGADRQVEVPHSRIRELGRMGRALEAAGRQRARREVERARLLASLEDALEQARRAGQAKDEFLAVLGHELRNPLSPIVASLDLMDMRDEPGARRERAIMRRQVTHLKRLVDDLLDVSRIASGKLQLELRPLNLAETVRHAVAALPGHAITLEAPDAGLGRGRRQPPGAGAEQPAVERRALRQHRHQRQPARRCGRRTGAAGGAGQRHRHGRRPAVARVRALLPGPAAAGAPHRRPRPRAGDRAQDRRAAWRQRQGRQRRPRQGQPLRGPAAARRRRRHRRPDAAPPAAAQPCRILLVDDNEDAAAGTASLLSQLGHTVEVAHNATQALAAARAQPPCRWPSSTSACRTWTATRWRCCCAASMARAAPGGPVRLRPAGRRRAGGRRRLRPAPDQAGGPRRPAARDRPYSPHPAP